MPPIEVLLAAYNGAAFIREQIQSILDQDYDGLITIHVRDDGSTDHTVALVQEMMHQPLPPQRQLCLLQRTTGVGGLSANLSALICAVLDSDSDSDSGRYLALADQDDIWLPYKLRLQMRALLSAETRSPAGTPLLICTDLTVVDAQLRPLHHSFWQFQKLNPEWAHKWQTLLVQNMMTGCTSLFNVAAAKVIVPMPTAHGVFHDHWMATAVAYYGQVIPLAEQTVLYRQHGSNVVGAQTFNLQQVRRKLGQLNLIVQRSQAIAHALGQPRHTTYLLWHKFCIGFKRVFF